MKVLMTFDDRCHAIAKISKYNMYNVPGYSDSEVKSKTKGVINDIFDSYIIAVAIRLWIKADYLLDIKHDDKIIALYPAPNCDRRYDKNGYLIESSKWYKEEMI